MKRSVMNALHLGSNNLNYVNVKRVMGTMSRFYRLKPNETISEHVRTGLRVTPPGNSRRPTGGFRGCQVGINTPPSFDH